MEDMNFLFENGIKKETNTLWPSVGVFIGGCIVCLVFSEGGTLHIRLVGRDCRELGVGVERDNQEATGNAVILT